MDSTHQQTGCNVVGDGRLQPTSVVGATQLACTGSLAPSHAGGQLQSRDAPAHLLFAGCSDRELRYLATQADAVQAPAGTVLTVEGRPPDTFYMLLEGVVQAKTAGEADVQYGPGAGFDVVAMTERSPVRARITADGPVRMLVMSHAQFRAVAALPRLQDALWRVTSPVAVALSLQRRHPTPARLCWLGSVSVPEILYG